MYNAQYDIHIMNLPLLETLGELVCQFQRFHKSLLTGSRDKYATVTRSCLPSSAHKIRVHMFTFRANSNARIVFQQRESARQLRSTLLPNKLTYRQRCRLLLRKCSARISTGTPCIVTEVFHGFSAPPQQMPEWYLSQASNASSKCTIYHSSYTRSCIV
jgi:hypothetical protein